MPTPKRIAIIGATGYTGSELLRLLHHRTDIEIVAITSERRAGERFSDVHPFFEGIAEQKLLHAAEVAALQPDLVFLALPHGVSMRFVEDFKDAPFKIIDLSGDFRLSSPEVYEDWYQKDHSYPEGFAEAAFGLPELFAEDIKKARLIANPGCYPTSAILGLAPLIKAGWLENRGIIIDSKSGVTGAGVKAKAVNHFSSVNDNFKAYGLKKHRHSVEIEEKLSQLGGQAVQLQFTPHLLPVDRGILSTMYARPNRSITEAELRALYQDFYAHAPFVRLREQLPSLKAVRGTNYCDLQVHWDARTGNIIVLSAIDNLVKGAAGQAIQNMNLLFGWAQARGLAQPPLQP